MRARCIKWQQDADFLRTAGRRKMGGSHGEKNALDVSEVRPTTERLFVSKPSYGVGKADIAMSILGELPDNATIMPDVENPCRHFLRSPGAKILIEQTSVS
jgi:pyrimidine deaminase RibD-like protein